METISPETAVLPHLPFLFVFLSPLSICMLAPVGLAYVQHYGREWKLRRGPMASGSCSMLDRMHCFWLHLGWQRKPEALVVSLQVKLNSTYT
jgi:hypothetical protein